MILHGAETYYSCIDKTADAVCALGNSLNEHIVVFCEDKLTLSVEKAIAERSGGTFNAEVLTFGRYIKQRSCEANSLTKESAAIVVKKILGNLKGDLKALYRLTSSPAFAFETSELIAQLKSAKIKPEDLVSASESCEENIKAKISDIALVFDSYENFLKEKGLVDQNGVLDFMPELVKRDEKLKNSHVFVTGYSSLTGQICEIIKTLDESVSSLEIFAVFGENENLYCNEFYAFAEKLAAGIYKEKDEGLTLEQKMILNGLFDHHQFAKAGLYSDKVSVFEAKSAREEIEFIARRITYFVTKKDCRYSDFCLAAGNLPEYSLQIKKTFDDYGIPYFADEKRVLSSHPLAKLTISLLKSSLRGGDINEIKNVILNPLFIPDKSVADKFIRALTKKTVTFKLFANKNFGFTNDEYLNRRREILADFFSGLKKSDKARNYVLKISEFYEKAAVKENSEETENRLAAINAEEESAFLSSALDNVKEVAEKTGEVLGDDEITLPEFIKLLETGYNACEVGIIPQLLDCVYVAELKDCRYKRFRHLFAAGLNGDVPFVKSDTALLLDSDIADLEKLSVSVEPKISVVNKREKEAAGLAFASFSDSLTLSYSLLSPSGGQAVKSEVVDYIQSIFTEKDKNVTFNARSLLKESEKRADGKEIIQSLGYMRLRPAFFSLVKDADDFKNGAIDSLSAASAFLGALGEYRGGEYLPYAKKLLAKKDEEIILKKNLPAENYFKGGRVSASKIECYFSCPYKCFVKYCLGAADKLTGDVRSLDFGNVLHTVAENFVKRMDEAKTDEEAEILAEEVVKSALSSPEITKFSNRGDFAYALKLTEKEGKKLCKNIYEEFKNSDFRPVGEEVWFSDYGEYKPVPLRTRTGARYKLYGKADRVDKYKNYVRIVDYKTGNVTEKVKDEKFYTGQNLQLYLYMNAFVKNGDEAAGAYYYAVNDSFKKPDDDKTVMAGKTLFTDEIINATDKKVKTDGKSDLINVKTDKRSGKLTGSLCDGVTLEGYMRYAKKLAESAVSDMTDGVIIPSPYKNTCDYCEYGGICGYDEESGFKERKVSDVKPQTIVEAAFGEESAAAQGENSAHSETAAKKEILTAQNEGAKENVG